VTRRIASLIRLDSDLVFLGVLGALGGHLLFGTFAAISGGVDGSVISA
jgi:hypothetical protein